MTLGGKQKKTKKIRLSTNFRLLTNCNLQKYKIRNNINMTYRELSLSENTTT